MVVVKTFQNGTVLNDQGRCNTDNTQRWPNFVLGKHTQPPKHSHATVRMRISTSDPRRLLSRSKACTHTLLQSHCCGEPGGSWQHVWYTHTQEARAHRRLAHSMQGCCTTRQGNQHTSIIPWQLPTASVQHWSRAFFQHPLTHSQLARSHSLTHVYTHTHTLALGTGFPKAMHPMRATGPLCCCSTPFKFNFAGSASRDGCRPCPLTCCPDHPPISLQPRRHRSP